MTTPNLSELAATLRAGRYACPVCDQRFHDLAKKKAHIHVAHGLVRKDER